MIEINGSQGEGGGQILRTALALSAIGKKPFKIFDIRASRKKPGLAAQHLQCLEAMAQICDVEVSGAAIGSSSLSFIPEKSKAEIINLFSNTKIDVKGNPGEEGEVTVVKINRLSS